MQDSSDDMPRRGRKPSFKGEREERGGEQREKGFGHEGERRERKERRNFTDDAPQKRRKSFDRDGENRFEHKEHRRDFDGDARKPRKNADDKKTAPKKASTPAQLPPERLNPDGTPKLNRKQRRALLFGNQQ